MRLFPKFDSEPTNRVILSGSEIDIKDAPPEKLDDMRSREVGWKYFGHRSGVIKDMRDPDPQRRYKMAALGRPVFECDVKRTKKTAEGGHPTAPSYDSTPQPASCHVGSIQRNQAD